MPLWTLWFCSLGLPDRLQILARAHFVTLCPRDKHSCSLENTCDAHPARKFFLHSSLQATPDLGSRMSFIVYVIRLPALISQGYLWLRGCFCYWDWPMSPLLAVRQIKCVRSRGHEDTHEACDSPVTHFDPTLHEGLKLHPARRYSYPASTEVSTHKAASAVSKSPAHLISYLGDSFVE